MIVKEVTESIKMKKLEVILRRLSPLHQSYKEVEDVLARSKAGFRGEKSLDYHLELLPKENCYIFHDLRLPHGSHFFQIDVLILSPTFLLMIEVKNMAGTLVFDQEFNQLIRINKEIEETFPSPISQVYRQKFLFSEWLMHHRIPSFPIESLIVISNPHTRIRAIPEKNDLSKVVIHSNHLLAKFHAYNKIHEEEKLSRKELRKLTKLLLKQHTTSGSDVLQRYNIAENEILTGVICPTCSTLPMIRRKKQWFCSVCEFYSKDAHVEALKDYALLFGPTITNKQFCNFLHLSSRHSALHMLRLMKLPSSGEGRHMKYHLIFDHSSD
jgi:hypothetical protein